VTGLRLCGWLVALSPVDRLRQMERHEERIRVAERARERRRMQPLMPTRWPRPSRDFEGAME
jgi:hypothetical protein